MDPQIYWEIGNSFIGACHTICFILYLFLNFSETHKFFAFGMEKLSILCWAIDKLENQGPSSNNATSTRKEIPEKIEKKIHTIMKNVTFKDKEENFCSYRPITLRST